VTVTDVTSGFSSIDSILVTVLTLPLGNPVINGPAALCQGEIGSYTVNSITGATTYQWSVPANAIITSGQGTTAINVDWGNSSGGQVQLIVSNSCGSLPASTLSITINTIPLIPGPINGQINPCADGSGSYSILQVTGADDYQWSVTGGGSISSGQGTLNPTIAWNGSAGGDVCVVATNECGISAPVCISIVTTTTPMLSAGPDDSICGLNIDLQGSGTGVWTFASGPDIPQFADINNPLTSVSVLQSGQYIFNYSFSQNGCEAEDEVIIEFNDNPMIINAFEDCNDINTSYEVNFEISGGAAPYLVNGNPFTGGIYNSAPILSGEPYSFQVVDMNGCQR
jgi:hypothetical protein